MLLDIVSTAGRISVTAADAALLARRVPVSLDYLRLRRAWTLRGMRINRMARFVMIAGCGLTELRDRANHEPGSAGAWELAA